MLVGTCILLCLLSFMSTTFPKCGIFVGFCDLKNMIIDVKCDCPDGKGEASDKWPLALCQA